MYQQDIMKRLGLGGKPFMGGAVGNYMNSMGQAYNQGAAMPSQGMSPWMAGGLNMANKGIVDASSAVAGTPGYDAIKDQGMNAFTDDVRQNMVMRATAPMMGVENFGGEGLNVNKDLTPGKETTLDAIPHTLKQGGSITPEHADMFLNEYSNRPIVGDVVKGFMSGNPSFDQKTNFILENF